MNEPYLFACTKCPRTFKLEEFYEKHKKVHDLKKQHRCDICGFVYGAAKGLEGHIKTHSDEEIGKHREFYFIDRFELKIKLFKVK